MRTVPCRAGLVVALTAAALVAGSLAVEAKPRRHHVWPGKNAIQRAIRGASPGDVLLVHRGRYRESVQVTKRLKIRAAGKVRPTISARCSAGTTVNVLANGVRLRRLRLIGATGSGIPFNGFEVNFAGVSNGAARHLIVRDTCGDAEYGINVYRTGPITLVGNRARGFGDAGIYVGDILTGPVRIRGNEALGNNVGILLEDSEPGTLVARDNLTHRNGLAGETAHPSGIVIRRTDGSVLVGNRSEGNGDYGIWVEVTSGGTVLNDNVASDNGVADFADDNGTSCGTGNSFPVAPCPP